MNLSFSAVRTLLLTTGRETLDDDVPSLAAAIAYYTVFSLPPLLVVIVAVAGAVFGPDRVQEALMGQIGGLVGPEGQAEVETMITNASDIGTGIGAKLAGLAALLFGATGAFGQLQKALNRAWEVEPQQGGLKAFLAKRLLSFGLVLTIAFLLLVSLAVSAALSAVGDAASAIATDTVAGPLMQLANVAVSLAVITVLFALMFKVLPDAEIAWRDVFVGGFVTAILFTLGKQLIGVYLGTAEPGSAFGAAGSLVLILIWIYYSALILLAGAEFTQVWAVRRGSGLVPEPGATGTPGTVDVPESATPATGSSAASPRTPRAPDAGGYSIEDASSGLTRR